MYALKMFQVESKWSAEQRNSTSFQGPQTCLQDHMQWTSGPFQDLNNSMEVLHGKFWTSVPITFSSS